MNNGGYSQAGKNFFKAFTGDDCDGGYIGSGSPFFLGGDKITVLLIHIPDGDLVDGAQTRGQVDDIAGV